MVASREEMDGDLRGRQPIVLLAYFAGVVGLLLLVAWVMRSNWLWDAPLVALPIAGATCFPVQLLVMRTGWWKRLSGPKSTGVGLVRFLGIVLTLGSFALMPLGFSAGEHDQKLARSRPVQPAEVVSVTEEGWWGDVVVKIAHPEDGAVVELRGGNEIEPRPVVGDRVEVIPALLDTENVLAAGADWTMHWYRYVLIAVIALVLGGSCAPLATYFKPM